METKYKLVIPERFLNWVRPTLRKRQGEIHAEWNSGLHRLGWLEPVEDGPVSAEQIWDAHLKCVEDGILSRELEKSDFFEIWKICEYNERKRTQPAVNLVKKLANMKGIYGWLKEVAEQALKDME